MPETTWGCGVSSHRLADHLHSPVLVTLLFGSSSSAADRGDLRGSLAGDV